MNQKVTSREEILNISKNIFLEDGLKNFNMRILAENCNIALGTIYQYFPSKGSLITSVVENIWKDIFSFEIDINKYNSFVDFVEELFYTITKKLDNYQNFYKDHSSIFSISSKNEGSKKMDMFICSFKKDLEDLLDRDEDINTEVFNEQLSKKDFVDFIFKILDSMFMSNESSCCSLIRLIEVSLYTK